MTYRDLAVSVCKLAGQDLAERAEELIPDTEGIKDIDIWIRIPSLSDDPACIPEIEVQTNLYPKRKTMELIIDQSMDFAFDKKDATSETV